MAASLVVSRVQRFSVDDGPGIRTTVFLKGCNLRCRWCHNPENIEATPELQFKRESCLGCGACAAACDRGVHGFAGGSVSGRAHTLARERCEACGACADVCPTGALELVGHAVPVAEVAAEAARDRAFYERSGGGVTFSGGEPLLQHDALAEALRACKQAGLHTAVDTAGAVPFEWFEQIIPYTDLFLYDVKCVSEGLHRWATGVGNRRILGNARRLGEAGACIHVRTPFVEGVNADAEEAGRIADFVAGLPGVERYEPLAYHDYGLGKYELFGKETRQDGFAAPPEGLIERLAWEREPASPR